MSTGPAAVERISRVTGLPPGNVARRADVLKRHTPPLWARAEQGGGAKANHVEPHHLTCLALALAADPIADTDEIVLALRSLVPAEASFSTPFLVGATLGEALDHYIRAGGNSYALEVRVLSRPASRPIVVLTGRPHIGTGSELKCHYLPSQQELGTPQKLPPVAEVMTVVVLPDNLFRELGNLWFNTLHHRAQKGNAAPARTAFLGQDQHAIQEVNDLESREGEGISQPVSRAGSGRSPIRHRRDTTVAQPYVTAAPGG